MMNNLTYDAAMERLEALAKELEHAGPMSLQTYQQKADEAKQLIDFCRNRLTTLEHDLQELLPE